MLTLPACSERHDLSRSAEIYYNPSNTLADEDLIPGIVLSTRKPDELLINQETEDLPSPNPHIYTTDVSYDKMTERTILHSISSRSNPSTLRCNFFQFINLCCSWFCGLDGRNQDISEPAQSITANSNLSENQESISRHTQQRPWIEWFLNGNLVFILLVEITLFIVFSIPAQYTFLKE